MKGVVFTLLNDMVEEQVGLEAWETVLEKVQPESGGIYTSGDNYPDQELFDMVAGISDITGIPKPDLIKAFGEFCLSFFAENYAVFFQNTDAKSFLKSVEDVIHVEVRKLYPKAGLPTFEYEDPEPNKLIMVYRSPRRLFDFAEGLISGTAKHFGVNIDIHRTGPINDEDICCRFELSFS